MPKEEKKKAEVKKKFYTFLSKRNPQGEGFIDDKDLSVYIKEKVGVNGKPYTEIKIKANVDVKAGEWHNGFVHPAKEE